LAKLRQMLASDPELRPTTAIRSLGIADPATIRRLRDKLKAGGIAPRARRKPAHRARPIPAAPLSARPAFSLYASHAHGRKTLH
jgi:hypothetical protein